MAETPKPTEQPEITKEEAKAEIVAPAKPQPVQKLDWDAAVKHLDKVDAEVKQLAVEKDGQPKVGCNPFHFIRIVTAPLRTQVANEKTRDALLYAKVLQTKAEEPT